MKKMEKMSSDHGKLQEYSKQQKVQLDQQQEKIRGLEQDLRRLGDSCDAKSAPTAASTGRDLRRLGDDCDTKTAPAAASASNY
jgi:hypothetical protein